MKLRLHHIEMCVKDPGPVVHTLCYQFGFRLAGRRETTLCVQHVAKLGRTVFVITSRKLDTAVNNGSMSNSECDKKATTEEHSVNIAGNGSIQFLRNNEDNCKEKVDPVKRETMNEPWTIFCCGPNDFAAKSPTTHIDSVFNIAIEVQDLSSCMIRLERMGVRVLQSLTQVHDEFGSVNYTIIKSCCGNIVHTLIEKKNYTGWFLPTFELIQPPAKTPNSENEDDDHEDYISRNAYFDHVALVCRMGDTNSIISWYEDAFEMRRFITNREETEEDGLMIGDDVGLRLKVMEFWKCSEVGLASSCSTTDSWEILKIVVAESLPSIQNTQVENFINDHNGPGLQHIGLHTSDMIKTVDKLAERGVRFRQPPPTYYTEIGQLRSIEAVGEDVELLAKYGILLDDEADPLEDEDMGPEAQDSLHGSHERYLMQIFTYPIFDRDTFFLEVIQRKGARGFGVGNVTALARSVNAYQEQLRRMREEKNNNVYK